MIDKTGVRYLKADIATGNILTAEELEESVRFTVESLRHFLTEELKDSFMASTFRAPVLTVTLLISPVSEPLR